MSDSVRLDIISGFDARGITAAKAGMASTAAAARSATVSANALGSSPGFDALTKKAKMGAGAVTQLAGALGNSSGGIATTAKIASGAMTGFATGGWIGLAVAGAATVAMHFLNLREEAKRAAEAMKAAFRHGLEQAKARQIDNLKKEYASLTKEIDLAAQRMEKLASANDRYNKSSNASEAARSTDAVANIEAGYSTRMANAVTPEERATLAAEKNLDIARQKNADTIRAAQEEVAAAERSYGLDIQRTASAKTRLAAAQEQLSLAEDEAATLPKSGFAKERDAAAALITSAKEDIAKSRLDLEAGTVAVNSSAMDLATATTRLHTVRTEAAMRENAGLDAQDALAKAIEKRAVVSDRLAVQESRLAAASANEANARNMGQFKENARDNAVFMGARGLRASREAVREFKEQQAEDNDKEARWAANAERKVKAGRSLSEKDRQRLADFQDFAQLRNRGGQKEFDIAANEAEKMKSIKANLAELQKMNTNLEKNLQGN